MSTCKTRRTKWNYRPSYPESQMINAFGAVYQKLRYIDRSSNFRILRGSN